MSNKKMIRDYSIVMPNKNPPPNGQFDMRYGFLYFPGIDYTSDGNYDCDSSCNDGPCCCYRIDSASVNKFSFEEFVIGMFSNLTGKTSAATNEDKILLYAVEKILRINDFDSKESFSVGYGGGYYGDEVENITHDHQETFFNQIKTFLKLKTIKAKVEYLLVLEYGHVSKDLEKASWELLDIDINKIKENPQHKSNVEKEINNDEPFNYTILIGKKINNFVSLVDGYHRLNKLRRNKKTKVKMLVAR